MYSVDPKTGKKTDAHLHGPMLSGVSKDDDRAHRQATRFRAAQTYGFSDEELDAAYGKDSR